MSERIVRELRLRAYSGVPEVAARPHPEAIRAGAVEHQTLDEPGCAGLTARGSPPRAHDLDHALDVGH